MTEGRADDEVVTCYRCGRVGSLLNDLDPSFRGFHSLAEMRDTPDEAGRVLVERFSWSHVDGRDICYDCVTPAEQKRLASRYVELVRQEVERRQAAGVDPDWAEEVLISYAQVLQARLGSLPSDEGG
jgi:hypothetical protein